MDLDGINMVVLEMEIIMKANQFHYCWMNTLNDFKEKIL